MEESWAVGRNGGGVEERESLNGGPLKGCAEDWRRGEGNEWRWCRRGENEGIWRRKSARVKEICSQTDEDR